MDDDDLYMRPPGGTSGETLIAGPHCSPPCAQCVRWSGWRDAVESLPADRPILALLDGTLAFWDLQRGQYPRYVADTLIGGSVEPRPGPPAGRF